MPSPFMRLPNLAIMVPGSLVMERKMLIGIRDRAECLARQPGSPAQSVGVC
jgi:hypothetical protein